MAFMSCLNADLTKTPSSSSAKSTELKISMSCVGSNVESARRLANTKLTACSSVSWLNTLMYMYEDSRGSDAASFFASVHMISHTGSPSDHSYEPEILAFDPSRTSRVAPTDASAVHAGPENPGTPFWTASFSPPPTPPSRLCSLLCSHELGALPRRREDTAAAAMEAIEDGALASFFSLFFSLFFLSASSRTSSSSSLESLSSTLPPVNCRYFGCDASHTRSMSKSSFDASFARARTAARGGRSDARAPRRSWCRESREHDA
mmetsp:Transcript_13866/g.58325  ORF Transcript_13866/g.58325 Transcript_13866/m.58325 type:complete len:263 (-) Transcript_13866:97-885(-)